VLQAAGQRVEIHDDRQWQQSQFLDGEKLRDSSLSSGQLRILEHVERHPRGIMLVEDRGDADVLIRHLVEYLSRSRILVIARNRQQVRRLVGWLRRNVNRRVIDRASDYRNSTPDVMVTTSWHGSMWAWDYWETVIVADVQSAMSSELQQQCRRFLKRRTIPGYCVFPAADYPTDPRQLELDASFGPVVSTADDDTRKLPVSAVFVRSVAADVGQAHQAPLQRKRKLYWHSKSRNEIIAAIAGQSAATRRTEQNTRQNLLTDLTANVSVSILVESAEHARELAKRLIGWTVRDAHTPTSCMPGLAHREIGTFRCAQQWGIYTDVVIRADGTADWPLAGCYPVPIAGSCGRYYLIDFDDRMDQQAVRDTQSRRGAYSAAGWQVHSADTY
jgi:hypothetical protein